MKYSVLLIVTVIVIGISLSDAVPADKKDPGAAKKNAAVKKKDPQPEPEDVPEEKTPEEEEEEEEQPAEEEQLAEEEEEEKEEEEVAPPKANNTNEKKGKAGAPAQAAKKKPAKEAKRKPAKAEPEEEEKEEEDEDDDTTLTDLKNMAASMNPLNLIDALKETPAKKLKNAAPELKNLTQKLKDTPMGSYFQNLASIITNSTPQIWDLLFEVFPKFLTTLTTTTAQLVPLGATTIGRLGRSAVELADIIFGGAKDVLSIGNLIPGVNLLTAPLSQVMDMSHSIAVGTADAAVEELKSQAKRASKLVERQKKRTSSGRLPGGLGGFEGLLGA